MSSLNISSNGAGVKPVDGNSTPIGDAWVDNAEALADRSLRLAVCRDCYGRYLADFSQETAHEPLTRDVLIRHYRGEGTIGLLPISAENRCLWGAGDIDFHNKEGDDALRNRKCAEASEEFLREAFGLRALVCDSDGKGGYHLRVFFKHPIPAEVDFWLGKQLNAHLKDLGFPPIEWFPKQPDTNLDRRYGNWIRLVGKHHKRDHWTRILEDGEWLEGEEAIRKFISASAGDKTDRLLKSYEAEKPKEPPKPSANGRSNDLSGTDRPDEAELRDALWCLPTSVRDNYATKDSREILNWIKVGMALKSWDPDRGLDLWIEWSKGPRYEEGVCEKKWSTFHAGGDGVTVASIFKLAREHGWKDPMASFKERPGLEDTMKAIGSANGDGHASLTLKEAAAIHGGVEEANGRYPMFGVKLPSPATPVRENALFSRFFAQGDPSSAPKL
jgi:hypothetical protein